MSASRSLRDLVAAMQRAKVRYSVSTSTSSLTIARAHDPALMRDSLLDDLSRKLGMEVANMATLKQTPDPDDVTVVTELTIVAMTEDDWSAFVRLAERAAEDLLGIAFDLTKAAGALEHCAAPMVEEPPADLGGGVYIGAPEGWTPADQWGA